MTIVIGLISEDGLVLASDSQMSVGATRRPAQKIWAVNAGSFAFGLAGTESTMHVFRDVLLQLDLSGKTPPDILALLNQTTFDVLQPIYERSRQLGITDWNLVPTADYIVGAWSGDTPHLFHSNYLGNVTYHNRGFVSAGSGGPFGEHAITTYRHLRADPITLHQAKMLAFRVVQDAIEAAGPNTAIGGEVQMATVARDGAGCACELLGRDDPLIVDAIDNWRALEADRFRDHQP